MKFERAKDGVSRKVKKHLETISEGRCDNSKRTSEKRGDSIAEICRRLMRDEKWKN